MFKTVQANIPQLKATLKAHPECWFHGCGNIYVKKSDSDFRQSFTNPNSEEAVYRIHFTSVSQVPAKLEDLNKMLMSARSQELVTEKMPKTSQSITTIRVEDDSEAELSAEELEYQRLLKEEENAQKGK